MTKPNQMREAAKCLVEFQSLPSSEWMARWPEMAEKNSEAVANDDEEPWANAMIRAFADLFAEALAAHDSDCATHNEPAYPNGPCDCLPTCDAGADFPRVRQAVKGERSWGGLADEVRDLLAAHDRFNHSASPGTDTYRCPVCGCLSADGKAVFPSVYGRRAIYQVVVDTLKTGAPGLSDLTRGAIARSVSMKLAVSARTEEGGT